MEWNRFFFLSFIGGLKLKDVVILFRVVLYEVLEGEFVRFCRELLSVIV